MNRRNFLGAVLLAPAVVRAESLMKVRQILIPSAEILTTDSIRIFTFPSLDGLHPTVRGAEAVLNYFVQAQAAGMLVTPVANEARTLIEFRLRQESQLKRFLHFRRKEWKPLVP